MTKPTLERKLTAIFSADVKGYSILMADDEEATIHTITTYRSIMGALIEKCQGRVVDSPGDNLLAEFKSAVNAVQCAVEIQKALHKENESLPDKRRMVFRIGINIGDIAQEGDRIYGDGVNIAARIEGISGPGGVCISRNVYDHVKKKLNFGYEYIGEHTVKNISDPVRVYKVLMDSKDAGKRINKKPSPPIKKSRLKKWLKVTVFIILILAAVLTGFYWKYIYLPTPADIDPDGKMGFNLPEGPSIAVLPFVNMSKDPEQEYLCDGITENIIATLAQTKQFIVIARNSTFAYKNKSINVQQIGRELGARYLIEGSIQKLDDRYRFVVQLIDTETEAHIWAERYDRESKDIFNLQDEITLEILKAVGIKLIIPWSEGRVNEGISDIHSFIKSQKILAYFQRPTKKGYISALRNAKELIALNPELPSMYDLLAGVYITGFAHGSDESAIIGIFKASKAVKKSLSLDENNYLAYNNLGWIYLMRKQYDKAIVSIKKSMKLNPANASSFWAMGFLLNCVDKPSEALESIKIAIRLNPISPSNYLFTMGVSYVLLGQYEKAIETTQKTLRRQPTYWAVYVTRAIAYSFSGQEKSAKTAIKELLILNPDYSIEDFKTIPFTQNQNVIDRSIEVLRKAGLPES